MPHANELLAHLVSSFPGNTENIATEALRHVFDHSDSSIEALNDVVGSGVLNIEPIVKVLTQVIGLDGSQPDLVGFDQHRKERILVEVKFWANLTPNQPNGYLDRLPDDAPAMLIFLAPGERVKTLWPQLRDRVVAAGGKFEDVYAERRCVRLARTQKHLMVVSWDALLDAMAARSRDNGEIGVEAEIRQLRSLAKYADSGQFKPVPKGRVDFPDSEVRLRQFKGLIDAATERGILQEWISRKGLRATPRNHGYGRYIRLNGALVWFGINNELFESTGQTPLWVDCRELLSREQDAVHERLGMQGARWAPVDLTREVEYSEVLDGVVGSLRVVADAIAHARGAAHAP